MKLDLSQRSIKECLVVASKRGERILINRYQRVIGKTKSLIEFAKEHDYIVVVNHEAIANGLRFEYDYEKIVGINSVHKLNKLAEGKAIVFDECCSPDRIDQLINTGFKVATGFINEKHSDCVIKENLKKNDNHLLSIVLPDINASPIVHYKGKQIDKKIRVSFDWETNTDTVTPTYIHIEHVTSNEQSGNTEIMQHNHPLSIKKGWNEIETKNNYYM